MSVEKQPVEVRTLANGRVHASMKAIVNLGNYESIHLELGYEQDVPEGVSRHVAMYRLRQNVYHEMDTWLDDVKLERDGKEVPDRTNEVPGK